MSFDRPSTDTEIDDKRQNVRQTLEAAVLMRIETENLGGVSDNASSAGIMFFTDEPIRVTVEVSEPDGPRIYRGRLVRVQRMSETNTGLAIEFDEE